MNQHLVPTIPNPKPSSQTQNQTNHTLLHTNGHKFEVQLTMTKRKEVINLDSSSEKMKSQDQAPGNPGELDPHQDPKKLKVKKVQHKCQLCKAVGKKIEMKKCSTCKNYTHLHCLDEHQGKGKFICDRCKAINFSSENNGIKKYKKQEEKNEIAKALQKKLEKQKKRGESNRVLEKFREKYPFYVGEGDKIKFPIDDKLLLVYKEYFEISEARVQPISHPLIPSQHLGGLLQIENFIASFGKEFEEDYNGQYRKSALYMFMNCEGSDKTFQRLLGAIIKIYLKDIFQKNKTENVKILNDNCFFTLLSNLNEAKELNIDYIAKTAPQIIRNLSYIPSMKNSFKEFIFPHPLNLSNKINLLITLIQGLSEVDSFHDMVSKKSQKISQMTKNKADFIVKLKKNQAQALSNKQKLKQMLGKAAKGELPQIEPILEDQKEKSIKDFHNKKKSSQKLASDGQMSEKIIKDYKSKIVTIAKKIPFVISEVVFLGKDRNDSHYFFYLREPNRIYVRYRNFILDESNEYKIYESKQKIIELNKTLNTKGTSQKRLYDSINNLIKDEIIRNITPEEQAEENISSLAEPMGDCMIVDRDSLFRDLIINDVMEMEQIFSNYLAGRSYRWTSDSKREQFRFGFPYIEDLSAFKEQIKNLQQSFLFVEVVQEKPINNVESDSNDEAHKEGGQVVEKECRRRKPIRIWGINSERVKKFWIQYLQICVNYIGIWMSVNILKNYVIKYVEKKIQTIREQERREMDLREKENREKKLREQREKTKQDKGTNRLRSHKQTKLASKASQSVQSLTPMESEVDLGSYDKEEGVRTRRKLRPSNKSRYRPLTIDSNDEAQDDDQGFQDDAEEVSANEDQCHVCNGIGEVICCDTCPKVFHLQCLSLKETPEGEWSCMDCLHRINNERQTRSRARKLGRK